MTAALLAVFGAVWLGAVIAVSARDQWTAAIGLAIALVAAPLLADPLPSPALLGSLIVAGLLAAALVRTSAPARPEVVGTGWPAEALLATAGGFAGLGLAYAVAVATLEMGGFGFPTGPGGPELVLLSPEGLAAAGAGSLLAIALGPALTGRAGPRHAAALVLLVEAVLLLRTSIAGAAVELEVVAWAALMVAVAAAGSVLTRLAVAPADASASPGPSPVPAPSAARRRS